MRQDKLFMVLREHRISTALVLELGGGGGGGGVGFFSHVKWDALASRQQHEHQYRFDISKSFDDILSDYC